MTAPTPAAGKKKRVMICLKVTRWYLDTVARFERGIGAKFREARMSLGLTQAEFAESLGITNVYLSNIETGKQIPSRELVKSFVAALEAKL